MKNHFRFLPHLMMLVLFGGCSKRGDPGPRAGNLATDIDGNVYHTINIGNQLWMVENLRTTKYRNGDPIPEVTDNQEWSQLNKGAFCYYNNIPNRSTSNSKDMVDPAYGNLYNWHAVNDDRNIAPEGWRVPSAFDWQVLDSYLQGGHPFLSNNAGDKMKEAGHEHWLCPSVETPSCPYCKDPRNESGFTALPAGARHWDGSFSGIGFAAVFWSSSLLTTTPNDFPAMYRDLTCLPELDYRTNKKECGFSVRCIKD